MKRFVTILVLLAIIGCNSSVPDSIKSDPEVVEPTTHPPKFSYGDLIVVGASGDIAGVIIELYPITDYSNHIIDWKYTVMFENNQRLDYQQDEIKLFRKIDWDDPKIDKILLAEPPVETQNAEIENQDAIP